MKLLVGLGNPGKKYTRNRHNIGFMVIDEIARVHSFAPWRSRFKGEVAEGLIDGHKCLLLKPHTFMNLSGEAVQAALSFYKLPLEDIIVFHDEIDLAPAKIRVKSGGGNAGHNGLKSISQHLGNEYVRVRLGVGRPVEKADVANYVLRDFAKAEATWLNEVISSTARHVGFVLEEKPSDFMSRIGEDLKVLSDTDSGSSSRPKAEKPEEKAPVDAPVKKPRPLAAQKSEKSALSAAMDKWLKKGDNGDGV